MSEGPARAPDAGRPRRFAAIAARWAPLAVPVALALVIAAGAAPFVRNLSFEFAALMESVRLTATEAGDHGREHHVPIPYEPGGPHLNADGLTYTYDACDNIYFTPPVLRDAWTSWGEVALHVGALPLVALLLVGLGLRLRARRDAAGWTLDAARPRWKALLAAGTLLPFAAFAVPFALGLCVWLVVEIVPWLQWFDSVAQVTERVLLWALPPLLVLTLLLGAWLVRVALRRRRPAAARRGRWPRRLAVGAPVVLVAVLLGLLFLPRAARLLPVAGGEALLERWCSSCHAATAPLFYVRSPEDWRYSLESTCFRRVEVPEADREAILAFLVETRSFSDAWVFRTRCQRCHVTSVYSWEERHPDDWAAIVHRIARFSPYYYDESTQQQILRHLTAEYGAEDAGGADGERERQAVQACTACHFFSRNAEAFRDVSEEDAIALVTRKSGLLAQPPTPAQIRDMAEVWRAAMRDPDRLRALVPHDRPVLVGGLPW